LKISQILGLQKLEATYQNNILTMGDREEEDFPRPEMVEWDLFEEAVEKLFQQWEVSNKHFHF
jgi:hypothetical protein